MAYEYKGFATLGVNLNRQDYGSLDISQVFTSLDDLKYYVSKGAYTTDVSTYWYESEAKKVIPYPYAGQYLALVNNDTRKVTAYILEEKEDGTFDYKEVGITPLGDDATVTVDATGKISLYGIDGKDTGTFVPKLKDGVLVWEVPSTITVEGLNTAVSDLQGDVAELEAKDTALEGKIDGVEETVGGHTTAIGELQDADAAQDELIESQGNKITALEQTVNGTGDGEERVPGLVDKVADLDRGMTQVQADLLDRYTKSETNEYVAAEIAKMAHFSSKVVTSTEEMTDATTLYLLKKADAAGADVYEQYVVIEGTPTLIGETSVDLTDYAKTADVEDAIESAVNGLDAQYKAADLALGERIDGVQTTINKLGETYATIESVNKKADQTELDKTNELVEEHGTKLTELDAAKHTHDNEEVLAGVTAEKVAQWDAAEENVVKSVKSGELEVSEAGELSITAIAQDKVTGLGTKLAEIDAAITDKVDKKSGYDLISAEDLAKLSKLSSTGTLAAENIDGLGTWISNNRETVAGLMSAEEETKLAGIAAGAQVNVVEGIKVGGAQLNPDSNKIIDIPFATNSSYGVVQGHEGENSVMINSSNLMEVHSLNVAKLVQDEGTVLVLNGGKA